MFGIQIALSIFTLVVAVSTALLWWQTKTMAREGFYLSFLQTIMKSLTWTEGQREAFDYAAEKLFPEYDKRLEGIFKDFIEKSKEGVKKVTG